MTAEISIHDVSLRFRAYRNPSPALKEIILDKLLKRNQEQGPIDFYALKNVCLSFNGGDRVGIIGNNGAGKSTLLKTIVGIYPPQEGIMHVRGRVTPLIEVGTGFDMELTGRQNIYLNGALLAYSRAEMRQREQSIIEFSELSEFIDMPVKYYSSGMYGRLAFSIATMIEPEILLVDEIFSTGDAHFVSKATDRMMRLFDHSQIVLMVSHSMGQILKMCNKAIVMDKGEVVKQGDPEAMVCFYLKNIANLSDEEVWPVLSG